MDILIYAAYYIGMGTVWCMWLEYFSTRWNIGPQWSSKERFTQIIIWPVAFLLFVYNLYKEL